MKLLHATTWAMLALIGSTAIAQSPPKKEKTIWAVIEVDGDAKVLEAKAVKPLRKELDADYKKRVAEWEADKKAARKEKKKFTTPKPKKSKVAVVKGGFKTEEAANAFLEKHLAKKKKKKENSRTRR